MVTDDISHECLAPFLAAVFVVVNDTDYSLTLDQTVKSKTSRHLVHRLVLLENTDNKVTRYSVVKTNF